MNINFNNIPSFIKRIKIDVGLSYSAPQSEQWLTHDDDVFVFGFEPNPECISSIEKGNIVPKQGHGIPISDLNKSRFMLIPVALGNISMPTELDFYMMSDDCGTSSLYTPHIGVLGPVKNITKVPVFSLRDFFDFFPWERFSYIEYLKIDAQGSDLEILKGAGDYLSKYVVYVTAEPESAQYIGCENNSTERIVEYMNTCGFDHINHPNTCDPTFINRKFKHLADSIFIYQRG